MVKGDIERKSVDRKGEGGGDRASGKNRNYVRKELLLKMLFLYWYSMTSFNLKEIKC